MTATTQPAAPPRDRAPKVTVRTLRRMKEQGEKIALLTAYDAICARLLDAAGIDLLLVGDSLGMVVQGHETTLPVTLDEMIYHCRMVVRGTKRAQVIGDLPFGSYQPSLEQGMQAVARLVKEGGVGAVKLEGGRSQVELVRRIVEAGVPVMAHIGLTPQSIHRFGGYRVQGRGEQDAAELRDAALLLQEAGAYALVLEAIPAALAGEITRSLSIPTIGIGAGVDCDGQVLVINDLLGLDPSFTPRFVKVYDQLSTRITAAVECYRDEVRQGLFPGPEHSF
ncbi:MAG: 3-methyl-2-oxobutanoate hydroxymethyltransferase [Myxococcota bacterium]|nr:3-methyl-2-oxobutanoate hydroxymethyltransferase [Myxococcota bacterium]